MARSIDMKKSRNSCSGRRFHSHTALLSDSRRVLRVDRPISTSIHLTKPASFHGVQYHPRQKSECQANKPQLDRRHLCLVTWSSMIHRLDGWLAGWLARMSNHDRAILRVYHRSLLPRSQTISCTPGRLSCSSERLQFAARHS